MGNRDTPPPFSKCLLFPPACHGKARDGHNKEGDGSTGPANGAVMEGAIAGRALLAGVIGLMTERTKLARVLLEIIGTEDDEPDPLS